MVESTPDLNDSFMNIQSNKAENIFNCPGTRVGPGGHDRKLSVKNRKTPVSDHKYWTKWSFINHNNTPGTRVGPGSVTERWPFQKHARKSVFFRKKIKITLKKYFFLHISSSYAKILGETNFRTLEIPRSGSKAKDGEKKREKD